MASLAFLRPVSDVSFPLEAAPDDRLRLLPPRPARHRRHRLQGALHRRGARLRLVARQAARVLRRALARLRPPPADARTRRGLHALPPDRGPAVHVLHRRRVGDAAVDRRGRRDAAAARVPAVLIPLSASVAIGITFCVNVIAVRRLRRDSARRRRASSGCSSSRCSPSSTSSPSGSGCCSARSSSASATSARSGSSPRSCCSSPARSSTRSASCPTGRRRSRSSTRSSRSCRTSATSCSAARAAPTT